MLLQTRLLWFSTENKSGKKCSRKHPEFLATAHTNYMYMCNMIKYMFRGIP